MNSRFRSQFERDESRYDDFYSGKSRIDRGRDDWGGNRDNRGFGEFDRRDDRGLMAAALQATQAQNVLAAWSQANRFQASGLLPTPGRYQDRDRRGGGYRGSRGGGSRGGSHKAGDKRRQDGGYSNQYGKQRDRRPATSAKGRDDKDKKVTEKEELIVIDDIDIPDEEIDIPDSIMDNVEKLRMREKVDRNTADEDIGKLLVFCYTGKGYHCPICKITLVKDTAFEAHLKSKAHVMAVIDARDGNGEKYKPVRDILDIDMSDDWYEKSELAQGILRKQAKQILITQKEKEARELANYNKNPANFFKCELGSLKLAKQEEDKLVFTHLFESTITVNDFTGDRFFGCEFIKAETGFNCRLCNTVLRDANLIIAHIDSKSHKQVYQNFLRKNPEYEKKQQKQNKELSDALSVETGNHVILNEPGTKEFISHAAEKCAKIPALLVNKEKEAAKKKAELEKAAKEKAAAEKAVKEKEAAEKKEKEKEAAKAKEDAAAKETDTKEEKADEKDEEKVEAAEDEEKTDDTTSEAEEKSEEETKEVVAVADDDVVEVTEDKDDDKDKDVETKVAEPAKEKAKDSPKPTRGKRGKAKAKEPEVEEKKDEPKEDAPIESSWCDDY